MKALFFGATLLLATTLMAQQQAHPPYQPPTQATPPGATGDQPPDVMPPDSQAPAQPMLSGSEVQQQIQSKIAAEPELAGANVKVNADERSITLTGTVESEQQHDLALHIAHSYAGDRPINDKIQIRGKA